MTTSRLPAGDHEVVTAVYKRRAGSSLTSIPRTSRLADAEIKKDLVAASARPLVLGILQRGPSYGYAIIQAVRELSGGELEWSEGMLYPVLHRLEENELISSCEERGESGRKRKYYKLTAVGRRALEAERKTWDVVHGTVMKAMRHA